MNANLPDQLIMKAKLLKAEQAITRQKEHEHFTAFDRSRREWSCNPVEASAFEAGGYEMRTVVLIETVFGGKERRCTLQNRKEINDLEIDDFHSEIQKELLPFLFAAT